MYRVYVYWFGYVGAVGTPFSGQLGSSAVWGAELKLIFSLRFYGEGPARASRGTMLRMPALSQASRAPLTNWGSRNRLRNCSSSLANTLSAARPRAAISTGRARGASWRNGREQTTVAIGKAMWKNHRRAALQVVAQNTQNIGAPPRSTSGWRAGAATNKAARAQLIVNQKATESSGWL